MTFLVYSVACKLVNVMMMRGVGVVQGVVLVLVPYPVGGTEVASEMMKRGGERTVFSPFFFIR